MTRQDIEAVISEVPMELKQQINENFQAAVRVYGAYSLENKKFPDYLETIDKLYKVLFPFFVEVNYEPDNSDMGKLLKIWVLTRKAIEKTVINNTKQPADLKSYIGNLSTILKCDIRFFGENYKRKG